jgi:hypothetical protein
MHESALTVTPIESPAQSQTEDVSLLRAALFGAVVPPFLATAALMLIQVENLSTYSSSVSLLFTLISTSMHLSIFCAPFGIPFAVLCGVLARTWLRRGNNLTDVQARLGSVGAVCGLVALWGVAILMGRLFDGIWTIQALPKWPLLFWGAAVVVGGICGWLLPRMARSPRSVVVQSA